MEEVDRLKQDGNKRRAKRARNTSSTLRKIILSDGEEITIKESEPCVVVSVSQTPESKIKLSEGLDLTRPDDRIINEALSFRNKNPDLKVRLLTHDTNPLLTAKNCGLEYIVIPDDWLLPPEPDARDKKINELETEINELKKSYPQIIGTLQDCNGNELSVPLNITITTYEKLSDDKVDEFISECKSRNQIVTDFNHDTHDRPYSDLLDTMLNYPILGYQWKYRPPSDRSIEEYKNEKYPQWLEGLREYFGNLHQRLEAQERHLKIYFILTNSGSVPAEHTLLEISASEAIFLVQPKSKDNDNEKEASSAEFPESPSPPKGKWIKQDLQSNLLGTVPLINHFKQLTMPVKAFPFYDNFEPSVLPITPKPRDRNAFYWKNKKLSKLSTLWEFECDEFRHKVDSEVFEIEIFNPNDKSLATGAIKFRVTARNLPKPFQLTLPVRINYEKGNTESTTKYLINKSLPKFKKKK